MATSANSPTPGETSAASSTPDADTITTHGTDPAPASPQEPEVDNTVHLKDTSGVRYIGTADRKILTVRDLVAVGVQEPKGDLVWKKGQALSTDEFNAATLHYLAAQSDFRVE